MRRITRWTSALCLALGLVALAGPLAADTPDPGIDPNGQDVQDAQNVQDVPDNGSYGYLRTVESAATLIQAGSSDRTPADVNQPVMVGDRIQVPDGSKVELVLPDHNLVRLDGGSDLILEHLAASPDDNDRATVLRLLEGNAQLVVVDDSLGEELPRVDTPNATVYPQDFGTYRIATTKDGWTEVTARSGKAQVVTDQDSEDLGAGEQAIIEANAGIDIHEATPFDPLERWAMRLDQDSQQADLGDVNEDLRYSAAPLNSYGGWVTVENRRYWRPRVADDWRPYTDGRWVYTPSGMTWVSTEPWGWVPYHYGSWDFVPGYGWLWQPGTVYSPAWVYWYWGPSYSGWCPMGYYTRYYASVGFGGFHAGLYGWAGGDWGQFSHWTFVSSSYWRGYRDGYRNGFRDGRGRWDVRHYVVGVEEMRRGGHHLERGLITTDTRRLRPDTWADPNRAVQALRDSGRRRPGGAGSQDLPDVSSFVARKPQLPPNVAQVVKADPGDHRHVGTPLQPNTLGRNEGGGRGMRGAHVVPVPQNKPDAVGSGRPTGRKPQVRPVPGQEGSSTPQSGRGGRNGGRQVIPVTPPTGDQPAPGRPRSGRPASGDQGGAPRPDRGGRQGGPTVIPVTPPNPDRNPRSGRPASGDQGGAPRPDHGNPGTVDHGNRGGQTDRGNQGNQDRGNRSGQTDRGNQGNQDHGNRSGQTDRGNQGNQDRGNRSGQTDRGNQSNQDRGNREKPSPPKQERDKDKDKDKDKKPPSLSYSQPDQPSRPNPYGERSGAVDRSGFSHPLYTPQPQPVYRPAAPQQGYSSAAPQPGYRPAERVAPPPSRPQPAPQPRPAAPSAGASSSKPAERHAEPPKPERHGNG